MKNGPVPVEQTPILSLTVALGAIAAVQTLGGCVSTVGVGGGFTKGDPEQPTGDGLHARLGVGAGGGGRAGTAIASAEYHHVGDFDSIGVAIEGGLHVWRPGYLLKEPETRDEERLRRALGKTTGGGVSLRLRCFAGEVLDGSGGDKTFEAAIGVGYDRAHAEAGPESLNIYVSVFRTTVSDAETRLTLGVSIGGTVSWQAFAAELGVR